METPEVVIARLVLGYLKDERCRSSHKEFLKSSHHLQDHKIASSKYIPTRYLGLTLGDILMEYFEISRIVQGRLESTSYYDEHHPKTSLVQQVLYLLNRVQSSRASTPCPSSCRSPSDLHAVDSSPSHREHTSDVDTTPAHTLPGNVQYESEESVGNRTPKRNGNKYTNCLVTSSPQYEQDQIPEVIDTEELAKTLLENTELHEKIAQTINKVAEKHQSAELDKTIKTVVKETERDPIFDKIIEEIIGSSFLIDNDKGLDTNSMTNNVRVENIEHKQKKAQRNSDHQNSEPHVSTQIHPVDQGNRGEPQTTYGTSVMQQPVPRQDNNEVIFFNGPLEKYLGSTTNATPNITQPQTMQTPFYLNTTCGGLLIPSAPPTSQIVLLNQPSPAPWQVTAPYLSEQDIMSMPTVIVNDTQNSGTKKTKHILPTTAMPTIEIPNLSEFINFHPKVADNKAKKGLKKVIYPVTAPKPNPPPDISTVDSHPSKESSEKQLPDLSGQVIEEEEPEVKTPSPLEITKKTTPKSGSHVRNLDFSTPPKITSTHKKNSDGKNTKAPQFVHKKQAAKSLFKKEETTDNKSKETGKTWDADLRAVIPESSPSRGKRNFRPKRKTKKAKLNTTAQDAALLEAALQTPVKKTNENQEETTEPTAEEPSAETLPENKENKQGTENKTVLSPSKLNNTKKNIMNVKDGGEEPDKSKLVTPELSKESTNFPVKANRNITPMLETPLKDLPKTPGVLTPGDHNLSMISNFTPFAKMLDLNGINIDSIPTPSIPITPSFPPFTPTADLISPYSNRPTDYSTGSSYYLPSDNEQNKSLEARLKEEEKKPAVKANKKDNHLEIFNKHVIGKKNLSLMKRSISSPSSCSDSSSDKDDSWGDKCSNDTIIFNKKETPRKSYSLRTRKVPEAIKKKSTAKATDKKKPNEVKKEKVVKAKKTPNEKKDNKKEVAVTKTKAKSVKEHSDLFNTSSDENALIQKEVQRIVEEMRYVKKESREKTKKQVEVVQKTSSDKEVPNAEELKEKGQKNMEEIKEVGKAKKTSEETTDTGSKTNIKPKEKPCQLEEKKQMAVDPIDSGEVNKTADEEKEKEHLEKSKTELIELMQITLNDEEASDKKVVEESRQKESTQVFDKSEKTSEEKKEEDAEHKTKSKLEMKQGQIIPSTLSNEKDPVFKESEGKRQRVMEAKKDPSKVKETSDENKDIKEDKVKPKTKQFKQTKLDSMKYIGKAKKTSHEKTDKKEEKRKSNTELIEIMQFTLSKEEASITEVGKADEKKEVEEIETKQKPEKESELVPIITDEKTLMLMELEEKRQRTIQAIQKDGAESTKPVKPQRSRKFKIKPILNVTCGRKKMSPKKSVQPKRAPQPKKPAQPKLPEKPRSILHSDLYDSDESDENISLRLSPCPNDVKSRADLSSNSGKIDPTASDVEAHNLIEGLKERGIHLMMNKSPKKKTVQEKEAEKQPIEEISSTSIVVLERETFDKKLLVGEDFHFVFDETVSVPIQNNPGRFQDPEKGFVGKVYFEEIGGEVDIKLKFTKASIFFDMPSTTEAVEVKAVESSKKIIIHQEVVVIKDVIEGIGSCRKEAAIEAVATTDNVIDDDLMDFAATGNDEPKTSSPKSSRKRKLSEDGRESENEAKRILKRLDVDSFLNNIHADTNFHVMK